jgi:hypothetical protein
MLGKNLGKARPRKRKHGLSPAHMQDSRANWSIEAYQPCTPTRVGFETTLLRFADDVDPRKTDIILHCKLRGVYDPLPSTWMQD